MFSKTDTESPRRNNLVTAVAQILRKEIDARGPIPFARFMEVALYSPDIGYYERPQQVIGRAGDYFTSVSVGDLFGRLLAFRFAEWLKELPEGPLQLVEAGAHHGQLARDVLTWLRDREPQLLESLEYWIIEPSPNRQIIQRKELSLFGARMRWGRSLSDLPESAVQGIIFSNELLDAMPVRRFGWDARAREWFEWAVGLRENRFGWEKLPVDPGSVRALLGKAGLLLPGEAMVHVPDQFTVEVSSAAAFWWREAAVRLRSGKLLAIDYGLSAEEFFAPQREAGTVRAFHRHHLNPDVLAQPGEQDLTAHVNFTHLQSVGEAAGLQTEGRLGQSQFLTGIARSTWEDPSRFGPWTPSCLRQLQTLIHPEHLGRSFQVLVQSTSGKAGGSRLPKT